MRAMLTGLFMACLAACAQEAPPTDVQREPQAADLGIEFTLLSEDPGPALGITQPRVLPTTLLVDPQGTVMTTLIGPQTEAGLKEELALARKAQAKQ